jgi:uncharacterized protein YycO
MITKSKQIYFDAISTITCAIADVVGPVHSPWTHKKTSSKDLIDMGLSFIDNHTVIQLGDVLLTRTNGELTTLAIPGFWKHGAVYIGNSQIVEAVTPKVRISYLPDLIMKTDYFAVLRVKNITPERQLKIVEKAKTYEGRKYDKRVRLKDDSEMFCSEVVYDSVNYAMESQYLELWERLGYPTFTPQDCYNARGKFDFIFGDRLTLLSQAK